MMYNYNVYAAMHQLGVTQLRTKQSKVLSCILQNRDVLVRLCTGGGKSLLFQLPALLDEPGQLTLVFSPLLALQEDQVSALKKKGVRAALLNSSLSKRRHAATLHDFVQNGGLLYLAPEQLRNREVREALARMNLVGTPFSPQMPAASLHWIIADKNEAIVVESMADGLHVHDDPAGVLTNNPPFDLQMFHLNNYLGLSPRQPENHFSPELPLATYSRGMGALGLPGDLSSQSRFARVAFTRANSISGDSEEESVSQFFHILGSVDQQRGCCEVAEGKYEITIYTSCCSAETGTYYYTTYENHQITAVDMKKEALDSDALIRYPMILKGEIRRQN